VCCCSCAVHVLLQRCACSTVACSTAARST
jgi:hypothetical protein